MKKVLIITCALAFATLASAQMYKYIDKNGKTVYTDQPPPEADPKAMHVPSSATGSPSAPGKTAVQQDKELQKGRDKSAENAKKADETAVRAKAEEERCQSARAAYQQYQLGGRLTRMNDKGEKVFLGDDEIDAARERSRQQVEQYCKS
jgi:hypothetical protein